MKTAGATIAIAHTRSRVADYVALAKPRLNLLVVATSLAGFVMAHGDLTNLVLVLSTVIGTALVASGASAVNQVYERRTDALMQRTRMRPMADGRLAPSEALRYAFVLCAAGLILLALGANLLSAVTAFATLVSYAVIYTPLKLRTSFATVIGAVPGALPAVIGWTAGANNLSSGAWILFAIVFLWQLPHFLAIAWMCRDDYARAGFPMLPVIEPDGRSTGRQSVAYAAALLPVSLAPAIAGMAGPTYFMGALLLTLGFLALTIRFARSRSNADARAVFFGSITYLPILWILMISART